MKKQYIYSALVLMTILSAGCAKEIENTLESTDSAAIELSSVSTDPMTKAVITGTEFTTTEAAAGIGLFLLDGDGKTYGNNEANVKYSFTGTKWTASQPLRIGNTEGTLVGYYPYSEGTTNVKAIPVASSINGTDWLYGSITEITSAKAKTESLTLSHALTRLRITFKRDASFDGNCTLSSLTIEGNGIAASGTLNATTGAITPTKSAFTVSNLNATITTAGLTEDCLVVPAASSATPQAVTLKFTVDGKAYKVDLKDNLAVKLQSGIQTDITLTVKNTSVSVDGASIGAWGDGGSQTVTVGGNYTVTVKLADNTPASEVMSCIYVEGEYVKIEFYSKLKYVLECVGDNDEVITPEVSNGFYTFTISDITKDMEITVGYATVRFDLNNSNIEDNFKDTKDTTRIVYNTTISPTYASAEKHSFRGWYKDATCENPWNVSTDKVTKSITLYAKWTEDPTGTQINGHDFVKLGGYYWATENVTGSGTGYKPYKTDTLYGSYYAQADNNALNAAESWGSENNYTWTLPSEAQWQALMDYCVFTWTTDKNTGMNGILIKGRDDSYESSHSIFLPAAGLYIAGDSNASDQGGNGYYWSSTNGNSFYFYGWGHRMRTSFTTTSLSVRPVLK